MKEQADRANDFIDFIAKSPTKYHAINNIKSKLLKHNFIPLSFDNKWKLSPSGKYFIEQDNSALIAFCMSPHDFKEQSLFEDGIRLVCAHTDSPTFKIKPVAQMITTPGHYMQLNTQGYAWPILSTWFDRPLSLAGRVALKSKSPFKPTIRLIDIQDPILLIPNIAFHLTKGKTESGISKQKEMLPIMGEKAVAAAKAVNYSGAGTIEFLVDKNRNFYFLEMNTRLQVEHPITEEVVGVDLVKEQIRIANDEVLHLRQEELFQRGHAIECRICAEDTENNFMPSPGIIKQLTEPNGIGVRIDSYVYEGYEIPIYYDPMIGKLIVWATTRQYAIERMRRVLYEYKITGLKTNLSYLKRIMHTPDFVKGEYNTLFIEKNSRMLLRSNGNNEEIENIAMIASYIDYLMNLEENKSSQLPDGRPISRWREFGLQKGVLRI